MGIPMRFKLLVKITALTLIPLCRNPLCLNPTMQYQSALQETEMQYRLFNIESELVLNLNVKII